MSYPPHSADLGDATGVDISHIAIRNGAFGVGFATRTRRVHGRSVGGAPHASARYRGVYDRPRGQRPIQPRYRGSGRSWHCHSTPERVLDRHGGPRRLPGDAVAATVPIPAPPRESVAPRRRRRARSEAGRSRSCSATGPWGVVADQETGGHVGGLGGLVDDARDEAALQIVRRHPAVESRTPDAVR